MTAIHLLIGALTGGTVVAGIALIVVLVLAAHALATRHDEPDPSRGLLPADWQP